MRLTRPGGKNGVQQAFISQEMSSLLERIGVKSESSRSFHGNEGALIECRSRIAEGGWMSFPPPELLTGEDSLEFWMKEPAASRMIGDHRLMAGGVMFRTRSDRMEIEEKSNCHC
jgi:hypothetical protein